MNSPVLRHTQFGPALAMYLAEALNLLNVCEATQYFSWPAIADGRAKWFLNRGEEAISIVQIETALEVSKIFLKTV